MNDDNAANDSASQLEALRLEHRELDQQISDLRREAGGDQLQIARLKKRKLLLKDKIQRILDSQVPDIIA